MRNGPVGIAHDLRCSGTIPGMDIENSSSPSELPEPATISGLRGAIDGALATRDRAAAIRAALDAIGDGLISVPDLYTLVLCPLMADTGAAWQEGTTRVWEEHYATATVRTIVEALAPRVAEESARIPRRSETVLLACPPEEYHDLGLRMLLDRFQLAGYDAHFLGADTPVTEICDAAERLGATLVVLSASTHYHRVRLREVIDSLRRGLPESVRIAVGGPAFAHDSESYSDLLLDPRDLGLTDRAPDVEAG
jgi:MerR family transcriptional regulator, light-induced transcriptional regulator